MSQCPTMSCFLIMGYEESYIQEKIIKNFTIQTQAELELAEQKNKKLNPDSKILNEYKCRNLPSILFSLGSNFSEPLERCIPCASFGSLFNNR